MGVKCFNHVIERELKFCESADFDFFKQAKFSFIEKLEDLGCIGLFNASDEVYPQLIRLFFANLEKVEP